MSLQRRVGNGQDANRGALSIHVLHQGSADADVVAPLPADEDIWIAWQLTGPAHVRGTTNDGRRLHVAELRDLPSMRLLVFDGIEDAAGLQLLNTRSCAQAWIPAAIAWPFKFCIRYLDAIYRVRLQFVTGALYNELSGSPPPTPTSREDGFTGRRLP